MLKVRLSRWYYDIIPEKCYHVDLGKYHTYGIKVTDSNFSIVLHDVSMDKEVVASMTELFNKYQLSSIHLHDVVQNMLP